MGVGSTHLLAAPSKPLKHTINLSKLVSIFIFYVQTQEKRSEEEKTQTARKRAVI